MYMIQYGYRNSTASTIELFMEADRMLSYVQKLLDANGADFYVEIVKTENHIVADVADSFDMLVM